MTSYSPQKGDIIWINFDPQSGKEIQKRRPALVISSSQYNHTSNFIIVCPITSKVKGYPFEVKINLNNIKGAILADQIKSFDCKNRKAEFIAKCDDEALVKTLKFVTLILELHKIHK